MKQRCYSDGKIISLPTKNTLNCTFQSTKINNIPGEVPGLPQARWGNPPPTNMYPKHGL